MGKNYNLVYIPVFTITDFSIHKETQRLTMTLLLGETISKK